MARENTVKVSGEELRLLKKARDEIFGSSRVPLGEVISELYDPDMTTQDSDSSKNSYFKDFRDLSGRHILMGGRQIGKTTLLTREALSRAKDAQKVLYISPRHDSAMEAKKKFEEARTGENAARLEASTSLKDRVEFVNGGVVHFRSVGAVEDDIRKISPNVIIVDEPSFMDPNIVYCIDKASNTDDIIYAGTPSPERGLVECWAEYSPEHTTWHIPTTAAAHVNDDFVKQFRKKTSTAPTEIDAKYWSKDSTSHKPDHSY